MTTNEEILYSKFKKELLRISIVDEKHYRNLFDSAVNTISDLLFTKVGVGIVPTEMLKITLLFPNEIMVMITIPFNDSDLDGKVVYSIFENHSIVLSDYDYLNYFVKKLKIYLTL